MNLEKRSKGSIHSTPLFSPILDKNWISNKVKWRIIILINLRILKERAIILRFSNMHFIKTLLMHKYAGDLASKCGFVKNVK